MKSIINIACASDNKYAIHLTAMLMSCLRNVSRDYSLNIFVIDGGIDESVKVKILKSVNRLREDAKLNFISIYQDKFHSYSYSEHISRAAYYRIDLPILLSNIDKVIYLDCDLIVLDDISELWNIDFKSEKRLIACQDHSSEMAKSYNMLFNKKPKSGYFNSGVIMMDLDNLRKDDFVNKMHSIINKLDNKFSIIKDADQKYFNYFFFDKWQKIDIAWNTQAGTEFYDSHEATELKKEEFDSLFNNMKIIHYSSQFCKPWEYSTIGSVKGIYYEYLRLTEFSWIKHHPNFKDIFKKFLNIFFFEFLNQKSRNTAFNLIKKFIRR